MTNIIEIKTYSTEYHEAMQRFLDQLTTNPMTLTESMFRQLLESENSHLFFLMKDEQIAGMLTVGIYHSPTGGKAWIEDVLSLIHISEPTRLGMISYAVFCLRSSVVITPVSYTHLTLPTMAVV